MTTYTPGAGTAATPRPPSPPPSTVRSPLPPSPEQPAKFRWIVLVLWLAFGTLAILCVGYLLADLHAVIGRRAFVYGFVFALAPAPFLATMFVFLDRLRPEPLHLMLVALIWGTCIATFIALKVNGWMADVLGYGDASAIRSAVFIAPWVEEAAKALIIFVIVWWQRDRFMSSVGGVVYAGLIGVGFAFTENIVYYSQVFQHALAASRDQSLALDAVQELFWWRGVAAPFVHPMFTLMTGLGIGFAVRQRNTGVRVLAPLAGFLTAVLFHMSYNTLATYASHRGLTASYIGVLLPLLIVVTFVVLLVRRHERRVIAARLGDYVVLGQLDRAYVDSLATRAGRRRTLARAKHSGEQAWRRAKRIQRDGLDLGALRDRRVRGVSGVEDLERESELLARLRGADRLLGPDPHPDSPVGEAGRNGTVR